MKRHGYARWKEIDDELRQIRGESKVLGQLPDGIYECEIVQLKRVTRTESELTIKHGQRILSMCVGPGMNTKLQLATGFRRPDGGVAVLTIKGGTVTQAMNVKDAG